MSKSGLIKTIVLLLIVLYFFLTAPPTGLTAQAWHLAGIFIATMVGIMIQVMPDAPLLLISITAAVTFVPLKDIIIGFADNTVWLVTISFMMALGFKNSGLAKRLGLLLVMSFGKTSLRVAYCLTLFDAVLAGGVPSVPARAGGLVYPLMDGVLQVVDEEPGKNPRRIAGYLILLLYMSAITTGSLFFTGVAANPYGSAVANQMLGLHMNWGVWFIAALPGWVSLLIIPLLIYKLWPPELKALDGLKKHFSEELVKLGPVTRKEWTAAAIFLTVLILWVTGSITKIDATVVAFIGLSLMILFKLVEWKLLVEAKEIWTMLIWYGGILGLSAALIKLKFYAWLANMMQLWLPTTGVSTFTILLIVAVLISLLHYVFASTIGYAAAIGPLLFAFFSTIDIPRYPAVFITLFMIANTACLTHYGNGIGPIFFAKEYVSKKTWWGIGLAVGIINIAVYMTLGIAWWKWIGYWY